MSGAPDVRGLYAALGVELPERGGPDVKVRCFADPDAHRNGDRKPSCSVNVETGFWKCFTCSEQGDAYHAAVALGRAPRDAMDLLRRYGLVEDDRPDGRMGRRPFQGSGEVRPEAAQGHAPPLPSEDQLARFQAALTSSAAVVARIEHLHGWTPEALESLGVGFDGKRLVFPIRDSSGALVNVSRYLPGPERGNRPKMLAIAGRPRDLFPSPESIAAEDVLWVVEGEPDAVVAHTLGLGGVGIPGSNGWRPEWAERFAGRRVVIVPDCDKPGRDLACRVAASLVPHALETRVLDLDPDCDDGYDLGNRVNEASAQARAEGIPPERWRADAREALERVAAEQPSMAPPAPEEAAELLKDLVSVLRRYVAMSSAQAGGVALWVFHTHSFEAADATPYLSITSAEKESGKTRLLEVLELLVARPWLTGRVSAAVLARKVDAERPTLLLDESDAAFNGEKDYAEALRGLLNTGHRPGGKSTVCVGQGANIGYKDFSTFAPKAIAGIGNLPDTVASRSIAIRLKKRAPGEGVARFRRRDARQVLEPISEQVAAWALVHAEALRLARPALPDELGDRSQDSWEPLLAIADLAGGQWPDRARRAAVELSSRGGGQDDGSAGTQLLADIRTIFEERGVDRISSSDLAGALAAIEESPWGDIRGKPLAPSGLASRLKPYDVRPRTVRLGDATPKGYLRDQLEDAFQRYLASDPTPSRHTATTRSGSGIAAKIDPQQDLRVAVAKSGANPHGKRDVAAVAAEDRYDDANSARDAVPGVDPDAEHERVVAKFPELAMAGLNGRNDWTPDAEREFADRIKQAFPGTREWRRGDEA